MAEPWSSLWSHWSDAFVELKFHQNLFSAGSAPDLAGGTYDAPQTP